MKGVFATFRRELFSLFVTPLAWVLLTAFLVVQGIHFYLLVANAASTATVGQEAGPMQAFFGHTVLLYLTLLFICPLVTMRLFAEERQSGTIETLLTAPVEAPGIVLGKFAAAFATYTILWTPTLLYVALIGRTGTLDARVIATSYFAVLFIGAGHLAIGTLMSALASTQLMAAILTAMALLVLFMVGLGVFVFERGPLHDFCNYLSIWQQMNESSQGILDLRRLVLDATLTILPLFLTIRVVESWRWG